MVKIEVYFGLLDKQDVPIYESEFEVFRKEVLDQLLQGYCLVNGTGLWKGKAEPCKVLTVVGLDVPEMREGMRKICRAYKEKFNQGSVLMTSQKLEFAEYV